MPSLKKNTGRGIYNSSTTSKDRQKKKFYLLYRAGMLDDSKITKDGWKTLYEYELENGYAKPNDIPRNAINDFGIDTSLSQPMQNQFEFEETQPIIEPNLETNNKEGTFLNKLSSLFENLGGGNLSQGTYKRGNEIFDVNKQGNVNIQQPINEIKQGFNQAAFHGAIDNMNKSAGIQTDFNSVRKQQDDPLLMALQGKIDPEFIGQKTKEIINTVNRNRFEKQLEDNSRLGVSGQFNPLLPQNNRNVRIPVTPKEYNPNDYLNLPENVGNKEDYEDIRWGKNLPELPFDLGIDPVDQFQLASLNYQLGEEAYKLKKGQPNRVNEIQQQIESMIAHNPRLAQTDKNILRSWVKGAIQQTPLLARSATSGIKGAAMGGAAGATGAFLLGQAGPQSLTPEEVLTVPGAGIAGAKIGAKLGAGADIGKIESGMSFMEMVEDGVDVETADKISDVVGLINAGIELFQIDLLTKNFPQLKEVLGRLTKEQAEEIANRYVKREYKDVFKDYLKDVAKETGQEVLQEYVTMTGTSIGKGDGIANPLQRENLQRLGQTAVDSVGSFAILSIPSVGMDIHRTSKARGSQNQIQQQEQVQVRQTGASNFQELDSQLQQQGYIQLSSINSQNPFAEDIYINPQTNDVNIIAYAKGGSYLPQSMYNHGNYENIRQQYASSTGIDIGGDPSLHLTMPVGEKLLEYDDDYAREFKLQAEQDGYKQTKPGIWVKEQNGAIVDVRLQFLFTESPQGTPAFNLQRTDRMNQQPIENREVLKGFLGDEYNINETQRANQNVNRPDYLAEEISKVDENSYSDFMNKFAQLEEQDSEVTNQFIEKPEIKEIFDFIKNADENTSPRDIALKMNEFNKEYDKHFSNESLLEGKIDNTIQRPLEADTTSLETKDEEIIKDDIKPSTKADKEVESDIKPTTNNKTLEKGSRVSYVTGDKEVFGIVKAIDGNNVRVQADGRSYAVEIPLKNIKLVDEAIETDLSDTETVVEENIKEDIKASETADEETTDTKETLDELYLKTLETKGYEIVKGEMNDFDYALAGEYIYNSQQLNVLKDNGYTIKLKENFDKPVTERGTTLGDIVTYKGEDFRVVEIHFISQHGPSLEIQSLTTPRRMFSVFESDTELKSKRIKEQTNGINFKNSEVTEQEEKITKDSISGKKDTVIDNKGNKIEVEYRIVSADELIASHTTTLHKNENYPSELQPRDRERKTSILQVDTMMNNLNPEWLGESKKISDGSPIIGNDYVVESGNGRTIALQKMYKTNNKSAKKYTKWLEDNKEKLGFKDKELPSNPILVRLRLSDVDRVKFTRDANVSDVSSLNSIEQAKVDSEKLEDFVLNKFNPNDNGVINTKENKNFIASFFDNVVPKTEHGKYFTGQGEITQEGILRIRNAMFYKAYEDENLLSLIAEQTDNNIKTITNAMLNIVPRLVNIKYLIGKELIQDLDFSSDIRDSVNQYIRLKNEGKSSKMFFNEISMFGDSISNESKDILIVLEQYNRSTNKLMKYFNFIFEGISMMAQSPNQESLLGDTKVTKADIIDYASRRFNLSEQGNVEGQADIFQEQQTDSSEVIEDATDEGNRKEKTEIADDIFKNRKEITNILNMNISDNEKKNLIANIKNHKTKISRIISTNHELDLEEGQIWDNQGVTTSWTDINADRGKEFQPETEGQIEYVLKVDGEVEGYQVQYLNYDTLEELGLNEDQIDEVLEDETYQNLMHLLGSDADMSDEAEILIPVETKFVIKEIRDGRDDVGYIEVILEELGNKGNKKEEKETAKTTLYHGSPISDLTSLQNGTWFSPVKEFADKFAEGRAKRKKGSKATTYSVDVDLNKLNLVDISKFGMNEYVTIKQLSDVLGVTFKELREAYDNDAALATTKDDGIAALRWIVDVDSITEFLKSKGYDGIKAKEGLKSPTDYVTTYKLFNEIDLSTQPISQEDNKNATDKQPQSVDIKTHDYSKDYFISDVFKNIKDELSEIADEKQIKDIKRRLASLGYISGLEDNLVQQMFVSNVLEDVLMEEDLIEDFYDAIIKEIKIMNDERGLNNDNRANDTKTTDRKQPKEHEQQEVQELEEEQRIRGLSDTKRERSTKKNSTSKGTTKADDSELRTDATERSRNDSNERNDGTVAGNFKITDEITLHEGGKKTRYKNNVAAIKLVKQLDKEGRKATLEEQKTLAKYVGWGGITEAFYDDDPKWSKEYKELKELLTEEEYRQARESRLNAHYTAREVIDKMYEAVKRLGFNNGKILEPAVGSGNFFGLLPSEFNNSELHAVELEPITGKIAKYLYPDAKVNIMGYEKYKVPNNHFDLIISNVPFGNFRVNDKDYNHLKFSIHNYYFAKSLDKVKEGGIVAFVTSSFTMDSKDKSVREHINTKAQLLGAIRLPNNAFSKNAGTEVTTDIIFLKKLKPGETSNNNWVNLSEINGVPVNEYYVENSNMLLGTMEFSKNMYGSEDSTTLISDGRDISNALSNAIKNLPQNVFDVSRSFTEVERVEKVGDFELGKYDKIGSIIIKDDKAYQVLDDRIELVTQNKTVEKNGVKTKIQVPLEGKRIERIKGMINIKEALRQTIDAQLNDLSDKEINQYIKNLNKVYDSFVKGYGYINDNSNKLAFRNDADYQRIASLEKWDAKTKKYTKSDVFYKRTIEVSKRAEKADNAIDGLGIVLNEDGFVDINRIAKLINKSVDETLGDLKGFIFKNPSTQTYQTKDEYLSGNVKEKLRIAKAYAKEDTSYNENVEELEKVIPKDIPAKNIDVKIGQAWVDDSIFRDFANTLLENESGSINVKYTSVTGEWTVEGRSINSALSTNKYGTPRMSAESIIENLLNSKEVRVNVYVGTGDERTIDKKASKRETTKAMEKARLIIKEFKDYIFADADRREYLVNKYNELFNNTVLRKYDGSFLTFNGMNDEIRKMFRGYQKSAVSRIVFGGNTLLAHTVGSGKTFEMIAGAMELKRLGLANKPMFVVPNHLIEQWAKSFYQLYPNANILAATKDDFKKQNRARLFSMISNNNYDAVLVAHSSFGKIPVSKETQIEFINEEIADVETAIIAAKEEEGKGSRVTKQLETTLKNLKTRLEELNDIEQDNVVNFEELGVDYLFVDEAHNFKNLFFYTKMSRIAGVQNSKAKRATDMYMKTRLISRLHNNKRGIVFATGTPVSNSIAEMFTMQRYLQSEKLQQMGINHFDAWANMFGDTVTKPEVDKTGRGFKMKTRFTDYVNVPELKTLFRSFADIISQDDLKRFLEEEGLGVNALPELENGKPITVQAEPSEVLQAYVDELVERSEAVEKGLVEPTEDNALKITNDGRVSALDMRLIDSSYPDDPNSKLNLAINNIFTEYKKGDKNKTTQLVFSDLGTPKKQKSKAQKLKERKKVKANGYETYQWYYDKENEKKYVVVKIDKENEEVYKLFEDGDEAIDSMEDVNTDNKTNEPSDFSIDIDEYVDSLGSDETDFEVKFDIYNDIREKLVSRGIPRNEIAFIHEANTDLAKEKLFNKVRKGEVRILLGSTAKMGEGMNVQDRLIALHHLDAPWKPSAIEQRNGRIIRFGNMHKKVRIYQYVTKGSFDAYIWQMLERKATFISKIMDSDLETRKYKDAFDPVILNASEVKALASDDPRILEKFDIDKQVEELEELKQSHRAEQYEIQDRIRMHENSIKASSVKLENAKKDVKTIINIKGDNFQTTISGKNYTTRKDAGQAIMKVFEKLDNFVEKEVGNFGGLKLFLYRTGAEYKGILQGNGRYEIQLSNSPLGNITRLENLLKQPEYRIEDNTKNIERSKKSIVTYKEQLGKPFTREKELEKALKRQAELDNELSLDKNNDTDTEPTDEAIEQPQQTSSRIKASIPKAVREERNIKKSERKNKKPKRISEIIEEIRKDFHTSTSTKRFRGRRGEVGQFDTHSKGIKVRKSNDLDTISHELGHLLDDKYNFSKDNKKLLLQMIDKFNLSEEYKQEELPGEALAEFVRLYLMTENKAQELSQEFYDLFIETLDKKDLNNLNKHRDSILDHYGAELTERSQSTIHSHTEKKKRPLKVTMERLIMNVFDDLEPIRRLVKLAEEVLNEKLQYTENPYVLAMYSRMSGMIAKAQILINQTNPEGEVIGQSFKDVIKDIKKDEKKAFDDYLKVKHAITLWEYGKQVYSDDYTLEDLELMKATYERDYAHFDKVSQEVYNWWTTFIEEWVVNQGLLDRGVWEELKIKYPTYVPNFRVMEDSKGYTTRTKSGFGNQRTPIKKMKGSDRDTYSIIESLILYTDKIVKTQKRNEVGVAIHNLYSKTEGLSEYMTKITHETAMNKFNAMDLKDTLIIKLMDDYIKGLSKEDKILAESLMDSGDYTGLLELLTNKGFAGAEIIDKTIDDVITYFTPRMFSTDNSVFTIIDKKGKTHFYEVHDSLFLNAILNLNPKEMDGIVKLIGSVKRVMTTLTTGANPIFGLTSNIWGDVPEAYMFGSYKTPFGFAKGLGESFIELFKQSNITQKVADKTGVEIDTTDNLAQKYRLMGGGLSSPISENRRIMSEILNEIFPEMKKSNAKKFAEYLIGGIEQFNDTIETAPRLTEFNRLVKLYGDTYEGRLRAMYEANEVTTNFLRRGKIQHTVIGQGVPFLNAGLQGLYKLKNVDNKTKAKALLIKSLVAITMFELISMAAYEDDEDYEKLSDFIKDNYWLIKYDNGKFARIRKPRGILGVIFGSGFRRGFKAAYENDPDAFKNFSETINNQVLPPTDTIFSPIISIATNKSWNDSPVVPQRLQGRDPIDQRDANTSGAATLIADSFYSITGQQLSPKQIDYLIQQYSGVIGQVVIPSTSKNKTLSGSLKQKMTTDVAYSNDIVNEFYEKKEKLDRAYSTYNDTGKISENFDPVMRYKYNQVNKELSDLWKTINEIKESDIPLKDKQNQERELRLQIMELTKPENLKPTSYDEFKVLYNRGQDLTSKFKAEYEETKVRPNYTETELRILGLYNIPVDKSGRGELGAVNYQLKQIDKRKKQLLQAKNVSEAKKQTVLKQLNTSEKQIVDKYMEHYRKNVGIDLIEYFK